MEVIIAPRIAPLIVNISRYIAILTLLILSLTKEEAEPLEVAIMLTIPAAIASLRGMPLIAMMGMRILPPPSPVKDPRRPTRIEIRPKENRFNMNLCLMVYKVS